MTCDFEPRWAKTTGGFYVKVGNGSGDAARDPSGHAIMYLLGMTYNLSTRTFPYSTSGYVHSSSNANFSL